MAADRRLSHWISGRLLALAMLLYLAAVVSAQPVSMNDVQQSIIDLQRRLSVLELGNRSEDDQIAV